MSLSPLASSNALSAMVSTVVGRITISPLNQLNAPAEMYLTPSGTVSTFPAFAGQAIRVAPSLERSMPLTDLRVLWFEGTINAVSLSAW